MTPITEVAASSRDMRLMDLKLHIPPWWTPGRVLAILFWTSWSNLAGQRRTNRRSQRPRRRGPA